jgi:hypothetical protein
MGDLDASGRISPKFVRHWLILDVLVFFSHVLVIQYSVVALNNLSSFVFFCMLYELDAAAFCPTFSLFSVCLAFICPLMMIDICLQREHNIPVVFNLAFKDNAAYRVGMSVQGCSQEPSSWQKSS